MKTNIKIYNSYSKKEEIFTPIKDDEVSLYVCGPTVYNHPSIGNMRPVVVFDVFRRFLLYIGYKVRFASNITDVDDKIIQKALSENVSEKCITSKYEKEFFEVTKEIGSLIPDEVPHVTDYIQPIIDYIDELVKKGFAYEKSGNVYFRVSKIKEYGKLSGISTSELISGARIEENSDKESPLDFALWKKTNDGIKWDSPWGEGRPGWHTECCVMVDHIFNNMIDVHGGGYDLKFPHHENEIAQSSAMHGEQNAKYWMHNNFVFVKGEKMSKSLGNVITAKSLIDLYGGAVVRLSLLSTPYRQPINFTDELMENSKSIYLKIYSCYKQLNLKLSLAHAFKDGKAKNMDSFLSALSDDLNTSNAMSEIFNTIKEANALLRDKNSSNDKILEVFLRLKDQMWVLGIPIDIKPLSNEDISLYEEYSQLKNNKEYEKSDKIRTILIKKGIL